MYDIDIKGTDSWCIEGHSKPNGAKFLRFGYDPCQNWIKICELVTTYKVR